MQIRFAEAKDVGALLRLLEQVGALHGQLRPDVFRPNARKYGPSQLLALLADPDSPIFVAEREGAVVGYGFCKVKKFHHDPIFCERTELYIDDICVEESCRGQGVGSAIYQALERYAKMRKCQQITLNLWCGNDRAMAFYQKIGFAPRNILMERKL